MGTRSLTPHFQLSMYDRIEAKPEPGGIRVRLHVGSDRIDDFLYGLELTVGSVQERVARTFGVPVERVQLVEEFSNERKSHAHD